MNNSVLARLIENNEWVDIPLKIITREGRAYMEYFPRKQSHGDTFTPLRRLYLPTAAIPIISEVLLELEECCKAARKTAAEMQKISGPDLTFLTNTPNFIKPIHIDQNRKEYYLKDLLLVRHRGLSSGAYSHWIATTCTLSMMTTFLRYFDNLIMLYMMLVRASVFITSFKPHANVICNVVLIAKIMSGLKMTRGA